MKEIQNSNDRFSEITDEMRLTYLVKNKVYGDSYVDGFRRFGPVQLVSRMYEKLCRIVNILCNGAEEEVDNEVVADTLTDLANQAIILRMLIEDNDFENGK